ncbi:uncharacterized protein [Oscarella lobularis]|uniref:uncharacterized protein isoform X2 n=1 Tax=Oscarella lobularis TaxID=121494 RepID=UPI0033139DFB
MGSIVGCCGCAFRRRSSPPERPKSRSSEGEPSERKYEYPKLFTAETTPSEGTKIGPEHRKGHVAAVLDRQMLVWGGCVSGRDIKTRYLSSETIWTLNLRDNVWSKRRTTFRREVDVPIPSSASKIAVTSNRCIYHYGGIHPSPHVFGSLAYTSNLHTLDPSTFEWRIVRQSSPWPHGRSGCGMCLLGDEGNRVLVVFGGRGDEIFSPAPGSSWIPAAGQYREFDGFNNELWTFSLSEEKWIPLDCSGSRPLPRCGHTFTSINKNRAVLIGGLDSQSDFRDAFIFKLNTREFVRITKLFGSFLLPSFCYHSAVAVDVPGQGALLFVMCGYCNGHACIVFEIDVMKCRELNVPDGMISTHLQSVCCVALPDAVCFIRFGGGAPSIKYSLFKSIPLLAIAKYEFNDPLRLTGVKLDEPIAEEWPNFVDEDEPTPDPMIRISESDIEYDEERDLLGSGCSGEVYRAKLQNSDNFVAIKVFLKRRLLPEQSALLDKEAQILLSIKPHPHILSLIGICTSSRCYALVMEYISGGDLFQVLTSSDDRSIELWDNRLDIAYQIALGMSHLHDNEPTVIHLDLKSNNILVNKITREGRTIYICKICDFGLAKMTDVSSVTQYREEGQTPGGTAMYIAPERYQSVTYGTEDGEEKREIAKRSDVFSYGILLWEIKERDRPYKGMPNEAIHLHTKTGGRLPEGKVEAPRDYATLLYDCVRFNPLERPSFDSILFDPKLLSRDCVPIEKM